MKHFGIIKKIAGTIAAALVIGSAVLGCSTGDSSYSDENDTNGKARLLFSDSAARSLITPTNIAENDITKAELKAALVTDGTAAEESVLKTWTSSTVAGGSNAITLMKAEQNLLVDAGTYNFKLNLYVKLGNEEILCQSGTLLNQTVHAGDNTLSFNTQYVSDGKGKLSLELSLDATAGVDGISYAIYSFDTDTLAASENPVESGVISENALTKTLDAGYYSIALKLYNGETLLNTLDYSAKIVAGCTSYAALDLNDGVNTLYSLSFMLPNTASWVNNPGNIAKNTSTKITLPTNDDISRPGYKLTKWYILNTSNEYEPGEQIQLTANTTLYAKWVQIFTVTFVNGEESREEIIEKDQTVTQPTAPTHEGWVFQGWFNGDTKYNFNAQVTTDLTLTAKWLRGAGTEQNPYLIVSIAEWNDFANAVTAGETYEGKYFKMDADVGTETVPVTKNAKGTFKGTFDGDGKSLIVSYSIDGNYAAPFTTASGATIKNLTVKGTIASAYYNAAGIAGQTQGTTSITNCVSEVAINSSNRNYGYHGGFVGQNTGSLTISDSTFKGSLLSSTGTYACAGFVGSVSGSESAANLTNCVFAPSRITVGSNNSATFISGSNSGTLSSCYYTTPFGTLQGSRVYENAEDIQSGFYDTVSLNGQDYYAVNATAISGLSDTYPFTGSTISLAYEVKKENTTLTKSTHYTESIVKIDDTTGAQTAVASVTAAGTYNLVITAKENSGYHGKLVKAFYVLNELSGSGTSSDPYIIASALDWANFASRTNGGITYDGKYIKLTADIGTEENPVTLMAGSTANNKRFNGTFDGDSHTITVNFTTSEQYCGLFRDSGTSATVKNLTINGSIESTSSNVGGIAGDFNGTIENCIVNASITASESCVGGIVGRTNSNCTIKDCMFAGKLIGDEGKHITYWGGILGYIGSGSYTPTITNCVFAPAEISSLNYTPLSTSDTVYVHTICGNNSSNNTYQTCYYTKPFGYEDYYKGAEFTSAYQGKRVYGSLDDCTDLSTTQTILGSTFYCPCGSTITGLEDYYSLVGSTSVTPTYTVKVGDTTLEEYESFLASLTDGAGNTMNSGITSKGTYTLTISGIGSYTGKRIVPIYVIDGSLAGSGTESDPYIIQDDTDWVSFASSFYDNTYDGKFVKLAADIGSTENPVTVLASNTNSYYGNVFKGTFDGNGKILTVSYEDKAAKNDNLTLAPFPQIENATIKNLTIAGVIKREDLRYGKIAGMVGHSEGDSLIENCIVSVTLNAINAQSNSPTYCGGFVYESYGSGSLSIKDSIFNGKMIGSTYANNNGGFVGHMDIGASSSTTCNIKDCLFAPSEVTLGSTDSYTFVNNNAHKNYYDADNYVLNITDSYYTQSFGTQQGTQK